MKTIHDRLWFEEPRRWLWLVAGLGAVLLLAYLVVRSGGSQPGLTAKNLAGGLSESGETSDLVTDVFYAASNERLAPMDLIILVDSTGHIQSDKSKIQKELTRLIQRVSSESGRDMRVFVLGSQFHLNGSLPAIQQVHLDTQVSGQNALDVLVSLLSGDISVDLPVRYEAVKEVILLSDDPLHSGQSQARLKTVDDFRQWLKGLTPHAGAIRLHGVIPGLQSASCGLKPATYPYARVAREAAWMGAMVDLCPKEWPIAMDRIASEIALAPMNSKYVLKHRAASSAPVSVRINRQREESNRFRVSPDARTIHFHKDWNPRPGDVVEVTYRPDEFAH